MNYVQFNVVAFNAYNWICLGIPDMYGPSNVPGGGSLIVMFGVERRIRINTMIGGKKSLPEILTWLGCNGKSSKSCRRYRDFEIGYCSPDVAR